MGARLVKDINPAGSSSPNELISLDGFLFFSAELGEGAISSGADNTTSDGETDDSSTSANGTVGLIRSDGSNDGTTVLRRFDSVTNLVSTGDELYFIAGINDQYQLWSSDGTERGTQAVKDLYPNADPNFPQDLFEIDGVIFYSAIDGAREGDSSEEGGGIGNYPYVNGYEVWRREGSGVGSRFFRNLIPDRIITEIVVEEGGDPIITPIFDENGQPIELTTTTTMNTVVGNDGFTTTTTTVERETYSGGEVKTTTTSNSERTPTDPRNVTTTDVTETITLSSGVTPQVPLKKTTTVTKTVDIQAGLTTTTTVVVEDMVIDGAVKTETTTSSTQEAFTPVDLNSTTVQVEKNYAVETGLPAEITTTTFENDSFPGNFVEINGNYFFTAQSTALYSLETRTSDTVIGGLDLWFSDGTEAGTRPINVNENIYSFYEPEDGKYSTSDISKPEFGFKETASGSFPRELTPSRNRLYFVANDGNTGFELWSITDEGSKLSLISDLHPGTTGSSPEDLTMVGKNLYFSADDGSGRKLFHYNRSMAEPKAVKDGGDNPEGLTAIGNKLFYSAESELGRELWSAKKTKAGMVKDINLGSDSSSPDHFTMTKRAVGNQSERKKNNYLYFTANDGSNGVELMSLELKGKGNKIQTEADIIDGPPSSDPRHLTVHDQRLFFTAKDRSKGRELWTVGPSIQGPTGDSGAGTTEATVPENKTFVYRFKNNSSEQTTWKINGGDDSLLFKISPGNGTLSFKSAPDFERPNDQNKDNIYEVFVRSTVKDSGYNSDQLVQVSVINRSEDSDPDIEDPSDEILYYTEDCGPMTANGPLYPCGSTDTGESPTEPANIIEQIAPPIETPLA